MAIHLITGVPGAGKSLRAVWCAVNRLSTDVEQDRPIFGNVRGFRRQSPLPGSRYQNENGAFEDISGEWMDCPDGSLIMIDEVQERWRRYRSTGEPPPEIAALERHRHRNIDFIITCQNPKQLSDDVRSLVDTHEHLTKKGKGAATVYRWSGRCCTSPYTNRRDPDCETDFWRYPKWIFKEYVSADQHTVRNKVPRIFKLALFMLFFIPFMFWFAYGRVTALGPSVEPVEPVEPVSELVQVPATPVVELVPEPVPVPAVDPVTVYGGVIGPGDGCRVFDNNGRNVSVSWSECMNAFEVGFPANVVPLQL